MNNQRAKSFIYSGKSIPNNKEVYVIDWNHDIIIENHLRFGYIKKFAVSVRYFNESHERLQKFDTSEDGLAKTWISEGNQVTRSVVSKAMKKFRVRLGQGDVEYFMSLFTKHNTAANVHHREMNIIANKLLQQFIFRVPKKY